MREVKRILVAVDFSPHASKALDCAIELGKRFGAELHLLHCYQTNPIGVLPYQVASPVSFEREIVEAAQRHLAEWGAKVSGEGLQIEEHVTPRVPSEAIVELAREIAADLIVMGTRGQGGLSHVLLGSVAERTLRTAPCPVLTVHAEQSAA